MKKIFLCLTLFMYIFASYVSAGDINYIEPTTVMYDVHGNSAYVPNHQVEAHKSVGWFLEPTTVMYDVHGNSAYVPNHQVEAHKSVGWFLEPTTIMYDVYGNSAYVPSYQVEAHKSVGWFLEPTTIMYDVYGNSAYVPNSQVEAHKSVGWYKTYAEAQAAKSSDSYSKSNSNYINQGSSGGNFVYRTPSGKRYHFNSGCGGKNSYSVTLQNAKASGLTPCKKCAY